MEGRTYGRLDTGGYNIIPRHYRVEGYKNLKNISKYEIPTGYYYRPSVYFVRQDANKAMHLPFLDLPLDSLSMHHLAADESV